MPSAGITVMELIVGPSPYHLHHIHFVGRAWRHWTVRIGCVVKLEIRLSLYLDEHLPLFSCWRTALILQIHFQTFYHAVA